MSTKHASISGFLNASERTVLSSEAQGQVIGGKINNCFIWPDCVSSAQVDYCIDTINSNKWNKHQIAAFLESETGLSCDIANAGKERVFTVVE